MTEPEREVFLRYSGHLKRVDDEETPTKQEVPWPRAELARLFLNSQDDAEKRLPYEAFESYSAFPHSKVQEVSHDAEDCGFMVKLMLTDVVLDEEVKYSTGY